VEILNETRIVAIASDAECAGHDLAEDSGDMIAMFLPVHSVRRTRVVDDEVDDRARCFEEFFVAGGDAEFVFDRGEEFVEGPAHVGIPRRGWLVIESECRARRAGEQQSLGGSCRDRDCTPVYSFVMPSPRKNASRAAATGDGRAVELPLGSAADAPHGSRPEQVYIRLRDLIVQGLLAPGSRIVETEIATRLGVSRTPVREALQRLQQEGYVMGSPGAQQSRLTVAPLTRDDVYELLNIVGALEGMGARGAAQLSHVDRRNLVRDLRALNAEFHRAGKATPIDHSALYDADERFHRRLVEASAGPRLLALHDAVKPQAERYIRMYISMLTGDIRTSVYEHDIILAAIEEGRADDAELAVQVNWRHAADRLSKVIEMAGERGSW
jgi:DNA-binding GntR family transcriptional regulator